MSQTIEVVLDDQGRLVLPASAQRQLGLTAGMTLIVDRIITLNDKEGVMPQW